MSLIGRVFSNRYEVLRPIAQGGTAEVFLAHDRLLDRQVALKALFPEFARDPTFVERFRREAQSAASLSHQNIVAIHDWGQEAGTYFIVMEMVQGRSLRDLIRSEAPIEPQYAADICAEIAAALAFAHRNGLVHRDVKPGNVLLTPDGGVKVADFGIARASTSEALTQTGSVMGTATYFSPEQAQGHPVDGRSDVYSLGVVLYEMVTGVAPFTGDTPVAVAYKQVQEAPVLPTRRNPNVPADLEQIILTAMQKDVRNRYQTAEDLRADLVRFRRGRPLAGVPVTAMIAETPAPPVAPRVSDTTATVMNPRVAEIAVARSSSSRSIAAGVTLLVLAVIVGLVLWIASQNSEDGRDVEVLEVIGLQVDVAKERLQNQGFVVDATPVTDSDAPNGEVVSQDPEAGDTATKGTTINLEYSATATAEIPNVEGLDVAAAERELADNGFTNLGLQELVPHDLIEAGLVVGTDPPAGENQDTGIEIILLISAGPETVDVPNVLNLDVSAATKALTDAGFVVTTEKEPSADVPEGNVVRTNPSPNTPAASGSAVKIFVSSGPEEIPVPNVIGRTEASAIARLDEDGFEVSVIVQSSTPANNGRVIAQSPGSGTPALIGSTVEITVGLSEPATTTSTTTTAP